MVRIATHLAWPAAGAGLVAFIAGACILSACQQPQISCTAEVTEAKGVFHGTVSGARPRVDLEREALRAACGQRCGAQDPKAVGCVSQCAVDAEAGKIDKRSTCTEVGSR